MTIDKTPKLILPFDPVIKITLLFFHFVGFTLWIGASMANQQTIVSAVITVGTGLLLLLREILKDGFIWLAGVEGICTIVKVIILTGAFLIEAKHPAVLLAVMLLGILGSHLPKQIKDKRFL